MKNLHLFSALLLAFILRFAFVAFYGDLTKDYYWEHGELSKNLTAGKGYSLFYFQEDSLLQRFSPDAHPFPSAYMPPGYTFVLTPFIIIENVKVRNILLITFQTLCSLLLIYLLYTFTSEHFGVVPAIIAAYAGAMLPDFIYSVVSFTPTILYQCGIIFILILLYKEDPSSQKISWKIFAISFLLLYLRSEFFLFAILLIIFWMLTTKVRKALMFAALLGVMLTPWIIRNYLIFEEFIPFTTSSGLNFYRGNNPGEIGNWGDDLTNSELRMVPRNNRFEIAFNAIYTHHAIQYVLEHPFTTIGRAVNKAVALWTFDFYDTRNNALILAFYSLVISVFFFVGLLLSFDWKNHYYTYLFFLSATMVSAVFFVLLRYQTTLRAMVIPFASYGVVRMWELFRRKFRSLSPGNDQ
jgi:hypothetical protein